MCICNNDKMCMFLIRKMLQMKEISILFKNFGKTLPFNEMITIHSLYIIKHNFILV